MLTFLFLQTPRIYCCKSLNKKQSPPTNKSSYFEKKINKKKSKMHYEVKKKLQCYCFFASF